jgi:hypothetical protein
MAAVFLRYLRPYIVGSRSLCLCLARPTLYLGSWEAQDNNNGGGEGETVNSINNRVLMAKKRLLMAMKRPLMAMKRPLMAMKRPLMAMKRPLMAKKRLSTALITEC